MTFSQGVYVDATSIHQKTGLQQGDHFQHSKKIRWCLPDVSLISNFRSSPDLSDLYSFC